MPTPSKQQALCSVLGLHDNTASPYPREPTLGAVTFEYNAEALRNNETKDRDER